LTTVRDQISAHRSTARAAAVAALLVATSCQALGDNGSVQRQAGDRPKPTPTQTARPTNTPPTLRFGVAPGERNVAVDTLLAVAAEGGRLTDVSVRPATQATAEARPVPGRLGKRHASWRATERLEPGTTYQLRAAAVDAAGKRVRESISFRTDDLTLDEQTYAAITPAGQTVGVGMPAIVHFDVPVTDRAAIERHLHVRSTPQLQGSWHWVNDNEVHWRPRHLWPTGTRVRVVADVNGVDAGNGIYGQHDAAASFRVGKSLVSKVNIRTHQMRVFLNGKLARTIPITAGKQGFETRSGTKLIMDKVLVQHMDAATVGIDKDDPEYYNIPDVRFAMRLTYSGEFLHAAPWSVDSQGFANVSHGCVGMSVEDARWLYERTNIGDVVRVRGTDRPIEPGNGWTDWDVSYREYAQGSALS
jgi:lipoprotein-anchoring transpeptidase ErfK/SrfK